MQSNEFNVCYGIRQFSDILEFYVAPNEGIINYLSSSLKNMLEEYEIAEDSIVNFNIKKINPNEILGLDFDATENSNDVFCINIKVCKINKSELNTMEKENINQ